MDYTICDNILSISASDYSYLSSLLFPFTNKEIPHRICKNDIILDKYKKVILEDKSGMLQSWFDLMVNTNSFREINGEEHENIYISTCRNTSYKKLIVNECEDYDEFELNGISILNKDEAVREINSRTIVNIEGDDNMVSTGLNSPNTKGNLIDVQINTEK